MLDVLKALPWFSLAFSVAACVWSLVLITKARRTLARSQEILETAEAPSDLRLCCPKCGVPMILHFVPGSGPIEIVPPAGAREVH